MPKKPPIIPSQAELDRIYNVLLNDPYMTNKELAECIGWVAETFRKKKEFIPYIKKGKEEGRKQFFCDVMSAFRKNCCGYEFEEVHEEAWQEKKNDNDEWTTKKRHIKKIKKHIPASVTAQIFHIVNESERLGFEKWVSVNRDNDNKPADTRITVSWADTERHKDTSADAEDKQVQKEVVAE